MEQRGEQRVGELRVGIVTTIAFEHVNTNNGFGIGAGFEESGGVVLVGQEFAEQLASELNRIRKAVYGPVDSAALVILVGDGVEGFIHG